MSQPLDWLSQLLDMTPIRGHLDFRCFYGAPWRLVQQRSGPGEIPYHVLLEGSAVLEAEAGGPPERLEAGDILFLPDGEAHILHDGSGAPPAPSYRRPVQNLTICENHVAGDLDMLCGRFILTAPQDRLLRGYLPSRLIVRTGRTPATKTGAELAGLMGLMRAESDVENIGGRAMLNALSTALFTLTLRFASEMHDAPAGLLAMAGNPRLGPALAAIFADPAYAWSLPELARLSNMSRATLARQFQEKLGRSASDLITDIRMTLAANELRTSSRSTSAVAEAVGYKSEAAFQRAFKQRMGMTPASWRRTGN